MRHLDRVKGAFRGQAEKFSADRLTLAREEYLRWMVSVLASEPDWRVLDVAAGTGHLSRALAPFVRDVVALDATPAMLRKGEEEARKAGLNNISFHEGVAERLPFPDDDFDLVTCRFAFHHYEDPATCLREMVRVGRAGGRVAVIDLLAPEEEDLAVSYNRLERLRDPSHTQALRPGDLRALFQNAGLAIERWETKTVDVEVDAWLNLTDPPGAAREAILVELKQELNGQGRTGLNPFMRESTLLFKQRWAVVIGRPAGSDHGETRSRNVQRKT